MTEMVDLDVYVLDPRTGRLTGFVTGMRSLVEGIALCGLQPLAANPVYKQHSRKWIQIGRTRYLVHGINKSATIGARRLQMTRLTVRELFDNLLTRGFTVSVRPTRKNDLLPARVA